MQLTLKQAEYLSFTDLDLIRRCMELGLTPFECRVFQYLNACLAHGIEILDTDAAEYLEISLDTFYDTAALLCDKNLIPEPVIYLGGNENV